MENAKTFEIQTGLVLFYRPGCPYCQYSMPVWEHIKKNYGDRLAFVEVNIDHEPPEIKKNYGFQTVPTFAYYKDGEKLLQHGSEDMTIRQEEIARNIRELLL